MICVESVSKAFHSPNGGTPFTALDHLSCSIPDGCIYGMVGSNGAGKSTLLRLLAGVYRPDSGTILFDGKPVWENTRIKERIVYIPDDLYFLPQASLKKMARFYQALYPRFDRRRFCQLTSMLHLNENNSIHTFSKGMKKQVATVLALSARPSYLFFDETFDGLDPVVRRLVKQIIYEDVLEHKTTAIITSHSLRELEDTCDQLALFHQGGIVLQSDIQHMKTELFKVQIALSGPVTQTTLEATLGVPVTSFEQTGSVCTFIVRGRRESCEEALRALNPLVLDLLPLNLEEIFAVEMDTLGYHFNETRQAGGAT